MDQTNLANQPGIASTRMPSEQMDSESPKAQMGFVQRRLPWVIAGGALLFYLLTLRHWITFLGMGSMARATGWDWHPALHAPLQFLLTYPCRWLPPSLQLIALNLFAAVCATLTLALLARSVALLPQDRTRDQRQAERVESPFLTISSAWLPPLFAVLVCGLQMTFWEHAVVWTGEALDILLFAYVIRCLLEFRLDQRESWLLRMALVYGLAMTNNFAMIAFLPALLISLIWIKGLGLLNFRLCLRIGLCGLAGLSLYLLLPLIHSFSDLFDVSFWELLRINLGYQKNAIFSFRRVIILMLSFTSVMPVLFIGIKWPATFGDISAVGNALTNLMTHVIHGVFLLACLYVAFDPAYSPRKLGSPYPFLPFYYLGALSIGYFSGYFLLVFGSGQLKAWQRPSVLRKGLNRGIAAVVWVAALAVPVGLVYNNLPQIKSNLGSGLNDYIGQVVKSLPAQESIVLSDEPLLLYGLYAVLEQTRTRQNKILVETGALPSPAYHRYLTKHFPQRWPQFVRTRKSLAAIDSANLSGLLAQLSETTTLCYLQPSFGYFFERLYLKPRNLVYEVKPYPADSLASPLLTSEEISQNMQFWQQMKNQDLKSLRETIKPRKGKSPEGLATILGTYYSRALDYLGVELEKSGELEKAGECFDLALELNPDSASAFINRQYNQNLRAGHPDSLPHTEDLDKRLSRYGGNWDVLLGWNGPVDEPGLRNELALALARGNNHRQAAQQLLRIISLTPTNTDARIGLANMTMLAGLPDLALKFVADAYSAEKKLHNSERETLTRAEAWAHAYRNDLPAAEKVLQEAQTKYPLDDMPYSTMAEIYLRIGRITNAMQVLEKELKAQPENSSALNNFARLKILNNEYEPAIKLLDHALSLDPKNLFIIMNRSICNLKSGKLDDAQRDYQTLETSLAKIPYTVYYGLFDVAYKKKTPKAARKYAELYLKAAPKGTPEYLDVQERLKKAKSGVL